MGALKSRILIITREELESFRSLQAAIKAEEYKLKRMTGSTGERYPDRSNAPGIVSDIVHGSRHEIPYDVHRVTITGIETGAYYRQRLKVENSLGVLRDKAAKISAKVELIPGDEVRAIIDLYYIHGLTWKEVAANLWPDEQRGEGYPRKKADNWLKTQKSPKPTKK